MRVKTIWTLAAVVLAALGAAGCGILGADDREAGNGPGLLDRLFPPDPEPIVVPAGTMLTLRLENALSSHQTPSGATFSTRVTQEVSVDGRVAVPAGSIVRGRVTEARPPRKIGGRAVLAIAFDELEIADGGVVPISAQLVRAGKSEVAKDAAVIGGSALGGALLGEAIHEGEGATVGAIVGGIAGAIGAKKSLGKPVVLPSGTPLHIALASAVTLEERL